MQKAHVLNRHATHMKADFSGQHHSVHHEAHPETMDCKNRKCIYDIPCVDGKHGVKVKPSLDRSEVVDGVSFLLDKNRKIYKTEKKQSVIRERTKAHVEREFNATQFHRRQPG